MFNTNIKNIRTSNNKTQIETAKLMNIARSTYALWESNNDIIPLKRLIDFCNIFNCSLDYALGLSPIYNYSDINKELSSNRLKEFRKENNLTQEKVAKFLNIDQPTWSIYEKGKSLIGTPFLYMICNKYNISADYLLGRIDNPKYLKNQ